MRRRWKLGLAAGLAVAVAAVVARRNLTSDADPGVAVERWIPVAGQRQGPPVNAFPGAFSESGLKSAAREQFRTAQALDRLEGFELWYRDTCSSSYASPAFFKPKSHAFADLRLEDVVVAEFSWDTSMVLLKFKRQSDLDPEPEHDYAEFWSYRAGVWHNDSCSYWLGSATGFDYRTILDALERRGVDSDAAHRTPTPVR